MNEGEKRLKYLRAQDRVKKIRKFYGHLAIFSTILLIALIAPFLDYSICIFCFSRNEWLNLLGFLPWFLGLAIHGLLVFEKLHFIKKWEEKKLKEFLEEPQDFN